MAEDINCILGKCKNVDQQNRMMEEVKNMGRREGEEEMHKSHNHGDYDPHDKKGVKNI